MNLRLPPFWPDSARNEGLMNYEHIDTRFFVAWIPANGSAAGVIVLRSNVGPDTSRRFGRGYHASASTTTTR